MIEAFKTIAILPEQTKQPETINIGQIKKQVDQALQRIQSLAKKKSRFLDLYAEEEIERETLLEKLQDLENEQTGLTAEANRLNDIIERHTVQKSGMGHLIKKASLFADEFPALKFERKKHLIDLLINRILVTPGSIDISLFSYPGTTSYRKGSHMDMDSLLPAA